MTEDKKQVRMNVHVGNEGVRIHFIQVDEGVDFTYDLITEDEFTNGVVVTNSVLKIDR